jgi:carbohydrate kinase (thermoresistant glucokinase family)
VIIIVMGVTGSGKSTIGRMLAQRSNWRFIEGDDYHPAANTTKMAAGIPLDDADRQPWLDRLSRIIDKLLKMKRSAVISCSALKQAYREQLKQSHDQVRFIYLKGSYDLIKTRLNRRSDHFIRPVLLKSQFSDLEPPEAALTLSIDQPPEQLITQILAELKLHSASSETEVLLDKLMFPEAPRWYQNWLWFTDQHAQRVIRVNQRGERETIATMDDLPGGLGWLPDGRLLVVSMIKRQVVALVEGRLTPYTDLSALAAFHCNDMLVDRLGRSYVGNFGFDLHGGEVQAPAELILVEPNGCPRVVAEDLIFPNGCALSHDGCTLLVAETFASRITAFSVDEHGDLSNRRVWAELDGAYPDGIALDKEGNLWIAAPNLSRVIKVKEGGEVIQEIQPIGDPYACILGGETGETLFITSSESDDPSLAKSLLSGRIEYLRIA